MTRSADFESFLKDINPSKTTIDEASRLQRNLRVHLASSEKYRDVHIDTYLSGSYAKKTFIRPKKDSSCCDIDIVVETNHTIDDSPYEVLSELWDAIEERDCYRNAKIQNHSVGIDMSNFHIDVVPLARNSTGCLFIGSNNDGTWLQTNPKRHISWSTETNQHYESNFKPLVKIMKWWRRENCPAWAKFPKGITLEKMIADNLPETGLSIEERIIRTMANLSVAYSGDLESKRVPFIEDPAIEGNNLASKYRYEDFAEFAKKLNEHIVLLADADNSNSTWKKILGDDFPSSSNQAGASSSRKEVQRNRAYTVGYRQPLCYPFQSKKPNATITATVKLPSGKSINIDSDDYTIPKGSTVVFKVNCAPVKNATVKWQVTNTGEDAKNHNCLRGGFEVPNEDKTSRREDTAYTGKHYVQCFVIKRGSCVRWSKPFFINVE